MFYGWNRIILLDPKVKLPQNTKINLEQCTLNLEQCTLKRNNQVKMNFFFFNMTFPSGKWLPFEDIDIFYS